MKKMIYTALIITAFVSGCKKDSTNDNQNPGVTGSERGKIQYKVNGQLISYENVDPLTQYVNIYKRQSFTTSELVYQLDASNGANSNIAWEIIKDSLTSGSYRIDSISQASNFNNNLFHNGQQSSVSFTGDNFTVNITSHNNGRISGTFTGRLTPFMSGPDDYNMRGTTVITEGVLDNVKVTYQ